MLIANLLLVCLHISVGFAQLLNPFNTSALQQNGQESVAPCGVKVLTFQQPAQQQPFFLRITLKPVTASFTMWVATFGPDNTMYGKFKTFQDSPCVVPNCAATGTQTCSITIACGLETQPLFIYVQTSNNVASFFSVSTTVEVKTPPVALTLRSDSFADDNRTPIQGGMNMSSATRYDFFTFEVPSGVPEGSTIEIQLNSIQPISSDLRTSLRFGGQAFPLDNCVTFNNTRFLDPCYATQPGTWGLTIERTQPYQNYSVRVYLFNGNVTNQLNEKEEQHGRLRAPRQEALYRYNVPSYTIDNGTQAALYFFVQNVIGGTVTLEVIYQGTRASRCPDLKCTTNEGCHIILPYCQVQSGNYLLVVYAETLNQEFNQVQFSVEGHLRQIGTIQKSAGDKWTDTLFLSEYQHYNIGFPRGQHWLDIHLYVDTELNDNAAIMYVGTLPFPANDQQNIDDPFNSTISLDEPLINEFPTCNRNYNQSFWKRCRALRDADSRLLRYCHIQLDPCELDRFRSGVYLTVFNTNTTRFPPQHTWRQNPMDFTIYTNAWNPNEGRYVLNHGAVITDVVQDHQKKAYRIDSGPGDMYITISANYHLVSSNSGDTNLNEIQYEVIYSPLKVGPYCHTCYRIHKAATILKGLQTEKLFIPRCVEDHNRKYDSNDYDNVYLVIKGLPTYPKSLNLSENRFVITAKHAPVPNVRNLNEGDFSNRKSDQDAFGNIEYWILNFDSNRLTNHILSVKFRAHPRSQRVMTLTLRDNRHFNPYCQEIDYQPICDPRFELPTYDCPVSNVNKGYCLINLQMCNTSLLEIRNRVFFVKVDFAPRYDYGLQNYTDDVPVDYGYSLTYNLIPQSQTRLDLGSVYLVEMETEEYHHFYTDIPKRYSSKDSQGGYYLKIEAFFDSSNQVTHPATNITLYINDPTVDKLAGDPFHSNGCLCNKNLASSRIAGVDKFVYLIDRCQLLEGRYRWSLFTNSHSYQEGQSLITVKVDVLPYILDLSYDALTDFNLHAGQSIAFKINYDSDLVTSLIRVEKEVRTIVSINSPNYGNIPPSFIMANTTGDCDCGVLNQQSYSCSQDANDVAGRCELDLGFCQLAPGGDWFIIVSRTTGSYPNQVVPYTVITTRNQLNQQIGTVPVASLCNLSNRVAAGVAGSGTYVESNELQYFTVGGKTGSGGVFTAYLENITGGDVTMFFGNNYLPIVTRFDNSSLNPRCNDGFKVCLENGMEKCTLSTSCPVTHIGVRAKSRFRNRPATFRLSSCFIPTVSTIQVNAPSSQNVAVPGFDKVDVPVSLSQLSKANFPMLIFFINFQGTYPGGQYNVTFEQSTCGCSNTVFKSLFRTCAGSNCTFFIPVCDLPLDFQTALWILRLGNTLGSQSQTFSVQLKSLPIPTPQTITTNTPNPTPITVGPLQWIAVSWTLTTAEVYAPNAGIQTSFLNFTTTIPGLIRYYVPTNGDCPYSFTTSTYDLSACCTEPGTNVFAFFNNATTSVSYTISGTLIYQSTLAASTWTDYTQQFSVSASMVAANTLNARPTILSNYYVALPVSIPKYSTIIVQVIATQTQTGITAFLQYNTPAGTGHGGCFTNFASSPISNGNTTFALFVCNERVPSPSKYEPDGLYIALENTLNTQQSASIRLSVAEPKTISLNTQVSFTGVFSVIQQFKYFPREAAPWNPSPTVGRLYKLNFTVDTGVSLEVTVNYGTRGTGCTDNSSTIVKTYTVSTGSPDVFFSTCLNASTYLGQDDYIYIGVKPKSFVAGYKFYLSEEEQLPKQNIVVKPLALSDTKLNNEVVPTHYTFTVNNPTNTSVLIITVDGFTLGQGQKYDIQVFRDGYCVNLGSNNTHCSNTAGVENYGEKCTTYIPPCELRDGSVYHVFVNRVGGTGTYSIRASMPSLQETELPISNEAQVFQDLNDRSVYFQAQLPAHKVALYKLTLPSNEFRHGELVTVYLDKVSSCGGVQVYGYVGDSAGPGTGCAPVTGPIMAPNKTIISFKTCDYFGDIPFRIDLHILVRAVSPLEYQQIQFAFRIERTQQVQLFPFRYLEKHLIHPITETPFVAPCPGTPGVSLAPCCGKPGQNFTWKLPHTVYTFSVEGDQLLGNPFFHRLHLRLLDTRIKTAVLTVSSHKPSFCGFPPVAPDASDIVSSCRVTDTVRFCTVLLSPNDCKYKDTHQFFFDVNIDPQFQSYPFNNFTNNPLPSLPETRWDWVSLSHISEPIEVIDVRFSDKPQYFRATMALLEVNYYKVFHLADKPPNYHFLVTVHEVRGGTVSLANKWHECGPTTCKDSDCSNYDGQRPCTELRDDCSCKMEELPCYPGEINPVSEGFFRVTAVQTTAPVVYVVLKVTFVEPMITHYDPAVCDSVYCQGYKYYSPLGRTPGDEELYRYLIRGVALQTELVINDDVIALQGSPSISHAYCQRKRAIGGIGNGNSYTEQETYYRSPGSHQVFASVGFVHYQAESKCNTNRDDFQYRLYKYNLYVEFYTPPIVTLEDAVTRDSTTLINVSLNSDVTCVYQNETYWYRYTAGQGDYMVVELWSDITSKLQLWVTQDHVSYNKFTEAPEIGCTTEYGMPRNYFYCRYILFCNFTKGAKYYIQISDPFGGYDGSDPLKAFTKGNYYHHKIRASTMTTLKADITNNASTTFVLPYDLRQIQAVTIRPVSGNNVHGDHNLEVFVRSSVLVDTWVVRSIQGDARCSIGSPRSSTNATSVSHTVSECLVGKEGDVFVAHVIRTPVPCTNGEITVFSRFKPERFDVQSTNVGGTVGQFTTTRGATVYNAWTFAGGITSDQIVYGRLSNYGQGSHVKIDLVLHKGNHLKPDTTSTGVPCDNSCSQISQAPSGNVVWADLCWHCGSSIYDTIFAETRVNNQGGDVGTLKFNLNVQVTTWTQLTSEFATVTFPYEEASLAFFTATHSRDQALRVDVDVLSGLGIEINVYSGDCAYRTTQTQYWCFKNTRCEVPLPRSSNFGSYYKSSTDDSSPYLSQNLRIVIRGWDASFRIRQLLGTQNCQTLTSSNAPFCSTDGEVTKHSYWGEDNAESYLAKDRNALEFYTNLTKAFSCGVSDDCQCREQTEECRRAIKIYACQSIFNRCDGKTGLELMPTYRTCRDVEFQCSRTFICAGLPRLMCNHSFYVEGVNQVDQFNVPLNELDDPDKRSNRPGLIVLIIFLILLGIIVLGLLVYILYMRTSSMSSVVFDDSKLGEYEAM